MNSILRMNWVIRAGAPKVIAPLFDAAFEASRSPGADVFCMPHDQGMVFVEQSDIRLQVRFEETSQLLVAFVTGYQADTGKQTPRIGIDDKDRPFKSIQHDVIRSFRANTIYSEQ